MTRDDGSQRAPAQADGGGRQRLARPDPARHDRLGRAARLVDECSLRGVTSNPAIFEKAILGSTDYDDQLRELAAQGKNAPRDLRRDRDPGRADGRATCCATSGTANDRDDGFVSIEVMPDIAHDTDATIAQARDYWQRVDRPNLMVKIPGTPEGVPAIEQAISEGINVNVTLLFSVEAYAKVAEAYIRGLERRRDAGRVDSTSARWPRSSSRASTREVDKRLEELGRRDLLGHRRHRQRARRVRALQGDLPRRALRDAARRRRARPAPAVGVDRRQEPALQGHDVRRGADRSGHRQHDADADAARVRRPRRGAPARPPTCRPRRSSAALAGAGRGRASTWTT